MKYLGIFIIALATLSCTDQSTDAKLNNLQGYWNIEHVEKPDGTEQEFPFTNHMDFFEINGISGTKSRVSPTFDGKFISYGETIKFVWEVRENQLLLNFGTGESAYSMILREATKEEMVLIHEDGTIYHYLPYQTDAEQ